MVASAVATMVWSHAERNIASIRPSRMRRMAGWSRRSGVSWTAVTTELLKNEKGAQGATSRSQDGLFAGGVNVLQRNTAMQAGDAWRARSRNRRTNYSALFG